MEVPKWFSELLILAGLIVLATAMLRTHRAPVRRLGIWFIWGTIGLAIWFWTDTWYLVVLGLLAWFAIPVGQATLMSRRLRFSIKRRLTPGDIDATEFPELHPISNELREQGFTRNSDLWLKPSPLEQGFRIFRLTEESISAAVAVVRQGGLSLSYLIFATEDKDGTFWITWDYPLAYGLKMPPNFRIYRCLEAENVCELLDQHRAFLKINEVGLKAPDEKTKDHNSFNQSFFDRLFKQTMTYNLKCGLLHQEQQDGEAIRYSWRGTFFIAWQVLMEVVRG